MDQEKLDRAEALEAEAARLRREAFDQRPLPDFWRVGQMVRFLRDGEWSWSEGNVWQVVEVSEPKTPAAQYQVFWTAPPYRVGEDKFWTTPCAVELVKDVATEAVAQN